MIGKNHKGVVVTLLERKSRLYLAKAISNKRSDLTAHAINELLTPFVQHTSTITFDNGKEFANHTDIAATLDCDTYFAKPYSAWQRGANENAHGLLRQYLPKGMPLHKVKQDYVLESVEKMNNRPSTIGRRGPQRRPRAPAGKENSAKKMAPEKLSTPTNGMSKPRRST